MIPLCTALRYNFLKVMKKQLLNRAECLARLDELSIPFRLYEHEAVFNLEQMHEKLKLEKAPLIKNLFYTDKKPNSFFLVIAKQDTKIEKGFWKKMGTTGGNVRFAKDEQMN